MSLLLRARGCLLAALLFALFFLSHLAPAQAVTPGWQPNRTWVFAVSALKFQDKQVFDSFPTENRRDDQLVQFFRGRGVPTNHIVYCKDKAATLRTIQTSFKTLLQKAAPGDTLFSTIKGTAIPATTSPNPIPISRLTIPTAKMFRAGRSSPFPL